ncbi:putative RING-H2 finger protein atl12 [Phtheirospermum japonicum]|uniref:Putative RING-H2 finger protein atl12 n=1 Tax=Phtheirospermum japonicum TaxID=374723 RepID=A0A830BII0_9LAMI|nr:putative RING-H2 finger protein atl12 [Phtheirospermum japonicum]
MFDMLGSGMNLITTVIGFGMSATFIVFVCTRLICGRLRRIEAQQVLENDLRIDLELPERRISGLEPVAVAAIPTLKFNREVFGSMEDAQCSICLSEYNEKEVLRIMPKCGHSFHVSCIDIWLRKQSTCPVCRLSLQGSVETKDARTDAQSTTAQSLDRPEITAEHSQQWSAAHTDGNVSNGMHRDSVSVDLDSAVFREAIVRSS